MSNKRFSVRLWWLPLVALMLLCGSCKKNWMEAVMPDATGSPYDLYIVMDDGVKDSALGDTLRAIYEYPMECLPQGEPYFKIYYLTPENFKSSVIRRVGNVVQVSIDPQNADVPMMKLERDEYALGQVILKLYARSIKDLAEYLPQYQENLRALFVKAEIKRRTKLLDKEYLRKEGERLTRLQNVVMQIPKELNVPGAAAADSTFFWCTNDGARKRSDLIVYSIPYTDANVFTLEGAVAVRDSVLKANIEGAGPDSYMTTNQKIITPEYRAFELNGKYVGELRGIWRLENGLMAGPFVCHIRLDEMNQRVVFAEGFVYAPGEDKRTLLRNLEAVLYTLRLPSDNVIPTIEITINKDNE